LGPRHVCQLAVPGAAGAVEQRQRVAGLQAAYLNMPRGLRRQNQWPGRQWLRTVKTWCRAHPRPITQVLGVSSVPSIVSSSGNSVCSAR